MTKQNLIKFITAGAFAASLMTISAAPASAKPIIFPKPFPNYCATHPWACGQHHHHGYAGLVGAGLIGGLAISAMAADRQTDGDCYYVRRWVTDEDGNSYRTRKLVCD